MGRLYAPPRRTPTVDRVRRLASGGLGNRGRIWGPPVASSARDISTAVRPGVVETVAAGRPQVRLDLGAVPGVLGEPVARQRLRQQPDLAAAHCVRLAGQAERTGAWLTDLPGQQVQVDEAVVLPHLTSASAERAAS